jgi:putative SOS response-associated peptidase YedK
MFNVRKFLAVYRPNYNTAPQQTIPIIKQDDNVNTLQNMKWGIQLGKFNMINIRTETMEKPFFKHMEHVIIPANGFYEWKNKAPKYITLKKRELFGLAGIMHEDAVTIITTDPNTFMKDIHNRMPVIIPKGKEEEWITSKSNELLKSSKEAMNAISVSTIVNSPKNNSPECIKAH